MDNDDLNAHAAAWAILATEAGDLNEIAMRRAAVAQALALASMAESLAKIEEHLSAAAVWLEEERLAKARRP